MRPTRCEYLIASLRSTFFLRLTSHQSNKKSQVMAITEQLAGDILLNVFKRLDSKEMVSICRVSRQWLQIIHSHSHLWRSLVLPKGPEDVQLSALKLFDGKSKSTLREVSIESEETEEAEQIVEALQRSEQSLKFLNLDVGKVTKEMEVALSDVPIRFHNLVEFQLFGTSNYTLPCVKMVRGEELQAAALPPLRVLWIWRSEEMFSNNLQLFTNLSSFAVQQPKEALEWWNLLARPAQTLKHLSICIHDEQQDLAPLNFPNLQVLELLLYESYPSWMLIPSTSTYINKQYRIAPNLPSITELWASSTLKWENVSERCPVLTTLRMELDTKVAAQVNRLLPFIKKRRENVGLEVDGVGMVPMERLIVPFKGLKSTLLSQLREFVGEVIDLKSTPRLIEVNI